MVSDRPDPSRSDVVLQFYDPATKKSTVPNLAETAPLGHQDPTWRPDGKVLLYVHNARDGAKRCAVDLALGRGQGQGGRADRPGLPRARLLARRAVHRRDQDQQLRQRPRHPRRVERPRAAAADQRRMRRGRRSGRRSATRSRSSTSTGQIVDLELVRLDGTAPNWTVKDVIALTEVSGPRRRVATRLVHPGRSAAGADADTRRRQPAPSLGPLDRPVTATYLERLAARTAAVGSVLCLGLDPDPDALPRGFPADVAGVERFVDLIVEAAGPYAAAIKPNLAFYEALGSAGMAALERIRAGSRRTSRSSSTPSAPTSARPRPATRSRCSIASAPTRSPSTRTRAARRSRRSSSGSTASPTSCAGPRTRARPSSRTWSSVADPASGAPAEPLHLRVARHVATWGPGGTVGLVVGATAPDELRAIRARRARSRLPGPGDRRAGRRDRAGPARRAGDRGTGRVSGPVAACSSTCRGGSAGRRSAGLGRPLRRPR